MSGTELAIYRKTCLVFLALAQEPRSRATRATLRPIEHTSERPRAAIAGFRVQSANRYTTRPIAQTVSANLPLFFVSAERIASRAAPGGIGKSKRFIGSDEREQICFLSTFAEKFQRVWKTPPVGSEPTLGDLVSLADRRCSRSAKPASIVQRLIKLSNRT